jgi:hypothetical protein
MVGEKNEMSRAGWSAVEAWEREGFWEQGWCVSGVLRVPALGER